MGTSGGLIEKLQLIMFLPICRFKNVFRITRSLRFLLLFLILQNPYIFWLFLLKNVPFWNIFVYFDIYSLCWNNNKSKNWLFLKTDDFTTGISFYLTICRLQKLGFKNKYYCPLNSWQKEFIEFIIITWL